MRHEDALQHSEVTLQAGDVRLEGQLTLPGPKDHQAPLTPILTMRWR